MTHRSIFHGLYCLLFFFELLSPISSAAESVLVFQASTFSEAYPPHTIVLPDCRTLPAMLVASACTQTGDALLVYSLDSGACATYDASILFNDSATLEAATGHLESAPFVYADTCMGQVIPIDLASGAGCLDWSNGNSGSPPDECPDDPYKTEPGICGCGVPDIDTDSDDTADCIDGCDSDPNKVTPGQCGCGVPDTDTDADGMADCIDPDDDNDGMPDDWEEFYGLDSLVDDAGEDFDKDGLSNIEEYEGGSDPADRNDPRPRALPWLPVLLE